MRVILCVEDAPGNARLLQRILGPSGHELRFCENGQEALEVIQREQPDLVLMDVQLPGEIDGLEVVRRVRAVGIDVPIVAVTAHAMAGDRERCLEAGCDDYLPKPVEVRRLLEIVRKFLG